MHRFFLIALFFALLGAAVWLGLIWGNAEAPENPVANRNAVLNAVKKPDLSRELPGEAEQAGLEFGAVSKVVSIEPNRATSSPSNAHPLTGGELLEYWLTSSPEPDVMARNIIHGFGSLKPEDQALAASKAVAFIKDEHFAELKPLLMDHTTSQEAQNIIYQDLLQRSASTRLPLLLTLMQTPNHPLSDKARQSLVRDLGADYGANYGLWQAKINELIEAQK